MGESAVVGRPAVANTVTAAPRSGVDVLDDAAPELEVATEIWDNAVRLVPALKAARVTHHWARFRPHTPDELPVIGPCRDDQISPLNRCGSTAAINSAGTLVHSPCKIISAMIRPVIGASNSPLR